MAERPFSIQGIHHIAIQTRDWDASLNLYRDILGLSLKYWVPTDHKIALFAVGNNTFIELFEPEADTPLPGSPAANDPLTHIAISVDNVEQAINHVRTAGYEVTMTPKRLTGNNFDATIAFFTGPNGESIEFLQW
ncbi:MAG: VOC family protein, partial [Anaerolineae bacterium]|nr:VOC family protein [Anaerolineae bacterium]